MADTGELSSHLLCPVENLSREHLRVGVGEACGSQGTVQSHRKPQELGSSWNGEPVGAVSVLLGVHGSWRHLGMGNGREHDVVKRTHVYTCYQRFGLSLLIGGILKIIFHLLVDDLNKKKGDSFGKPMQLSLWLQRLMSDV